ncbi:fasciclin domain-containing protein [Olivibacter sitiensis]|uniref:fasciclin domain-containing protein n=1 Tax=Olivibacter sitiensis TaxID=376470 RepID=UPI00041097F4|nr:fasciclin domain-containing protein [Olivibacter sitiensis]
MKTLFKYFYMLLGLAVLIPACKQDDYFIGGSLHTAKVEMSTYDFLQSNDRGLFDTLLLLVDRAGVADKINQPGITFFAPTDYSINSYIEYRTAIEQEIDPFRMWTVDSIIKYELPRFADSLDIYIVPQVITYDDLTNNGTLYATQMAGQNSVVSFEYTDDPNLGYNSNSANLPQVMYYTYLFGPAPSPLIAPNITSEQGARTLVQTSGIETQTGRVNVLSNSHRLFYAR